MFDPDCLFCKIIQGEMPSTIVYQDELVLAFNDIRPAAPVHVLIVPKKHIADNNQFTAEDEAIGGRMFTAVRQIAAETGIAEDGYRLIMNTGEHGRQEIKHVHLHLIGGQPMKHPMG